MVEGYTKSMCTKFQVDSFKTLRVIALQSSKMPILHGAHMHFRAISFFEVFFDFRAPNDVLRSFFALGTKN